MLNAKSDGQYVVVTLDHIANQLPVGSRTLQDILNKMLVNGWTLVQVLPGDDRSKDCAIFRERSD